MSVAWNYSYPQPVRVVYQRSMSKEAEISDNLDVGILPSIPEPKLASKMFEGHFLGSRSMSQENILMPFDEPLDDILAESQAQIRQYQIKLPSQNEISHLDSYTHSNPERARPRETQTEYKTATDNVPNHGKKSATTAAQPSENFNQVIETIKTIEINEANETNETNEEKDNISSASTGESTEKAEDATPNKADITANRTAGDPLACHAENIMRMAMDSTMLGSFCNDTILSNFSNVLDDSFLAKLEEKSFSEEDILGQKPAKVSLSHPRAMRFDISAKDLEMAVNDPLKLS